MQDVSSNQIAPFEKTTLIEESLVFRDDQINNTIFRMICCDY